MNLNMQVVVRTATEGVQDHHLINTAHRKDEQTTGWFDTKGYKPPTISYISFLCKLEWCLPVACEPGVNMLETCIGGWAHVPWFTRGFEDIMRLSIGAGHHRQQRIACHKTHPCCHVAYLWVQANATNTTHHK